MRLLITGGAGFIGSWFVNNTKHEVKVIDRLTYAARPEVITGCELIIGDICYMPQVEPLVKWCDVIVHFAAESHVDASIEDPRPFVKTNIEGTLALIELATKYNKHFHHISTDEVFGDLNYGDESFNESSPYKPSNPYAATKAASDHLVRAWGRTHGLRYTISNCSNNYGPNQHPEKFIPRSIERIKQGLPIELYGSADIVRDWIHVADHCRAIEIIINKGNSGETYLVGARNVLRNQEVAEKIIKLMGKGEWIIGQDRPGHDVGYAIDPSKMESLDWKPEIDFDEGLKSLIEGMK